jgi:8-oxo-dGTP pyrophosphatase MutT (NUDIX family)
LPGGGLHPGETHEHAIARKLLEEVGLTDPPGPCIGTREHWFLDLPGKAGQRERIFLVQLNEPPPPIVPVMPPAQLAAEHVAGHRWWTLSELEAAPATLFTPRRLPNLLRDLLASGPPTSAIDVGV